MQNISIIIPIYNSEKTLEKCIKSIKEQTYSNWELILINDGSTDNSLELCNKLKENDDKIKIINQENKGVSSARNSGLKVAKGEYIIFVDSDDYIEPETIEIITKNIENDVDLLVFGHYIYIENILQQQKQLEKKILDKKENILEYIIKPINFSFFSIVWGKVFKKEKIFSENIWFDESMNVGEDTCFVLNYIDKTNNMKVIREILYNNIIRPTNSKSQRNINNIFEINKNIAKTFNSQKYIKEKSNIYFRNFKIIVNLTILYDFNIDEICMKILNQKEFKEIKKSFLISKSDRLIYNLIKYNMTNILKIIIRVKNKLKRRNTNNI